MLVMFPFFNFSLLFLPLYRSIPSIFCSRSRLLRIISKFRFYIIPTVELFPCIQLFLCSDSHKFSGDQVLTICLLCHSLHTSTLHGLSFTPISTINSPFVAYRVSSLPQFVLTLLLLLVGIELKHTPLNM